MQGSLGELEKFFLSWNIVDLQKHFNARERLITFQDSRLQKNVKLIKDFGLLFTHSLILYRL
jgi:hypothetical protein